MSRIDFIGCPIDCLDITQTVNQIESHLIRKKTCQHVAVNVSKFIEMRKNIKLHSIITKCDIINADGMPVVWASRILGKPLPERIAGIDLFQKLIKLCANKGYRPFFFGAREAVVKKVVEKYNKLFPELEIAGYRNGYFAERQEEDIANMISDSRPDILFVAFSSPMKEEFLKKWMPVMKVAFCMGVGGTFDVIAGRTKRAPLWMQNSGLEWFYRLCQEPRRLWKRYALTNFKFILIVMKEYLKMKRESLHNSK